VTERKYTMSEVVNAVNQGRMIEGFGSGTAAVVSPIYGIHYMETDYAIPLNKDNPKAKIGKLTQRLFETLSNIQYGRVSHPWSVVIDELTSTTTAAKHTPGKTAQRTTQTFM